MDFFSFSMASRRALRTLTLAVSASFEHCFVRSLRRSSVRAGMPRRMSSPLFSGMMPTDESMMAFSMTLSIDFSQGLMVMLRASGVLSDATLLSGTMLP